MSDDPKVDFYFRHRDRIEEWAGLRRPAGQFLHRTLLEAAHDLRLSEEVPGVKVLDSVRGEPTWVHLPVTQQPWPEIYLELSWDERRLLQATHWRQWASLEIVVMPELPRSLWSAVADAVPPEARLEHGLSQRGSRHWPWWGSLPGSSPLEPHEYAQACVTKALLAWRDLQPLLAETVKAWSREVVEAAASTQDK